MQVCSKEGQVGRGRDDPAAGHPPKPEPSLLLPTHPLQPTKTKGNQRKIRKEKVVRL